METKLPAPRPKADIVIAKPGVQRGVAVLGIGLGVGSWFLFPNVFPWIVGMVLGFLAWGWWRRRQPSGANLAEKLQAAHEERLTQLKRRLNKASYEEGLEKMGEQGLEQFQHLKDRLKNFQQVLDKKLSPTEIAYSRYWGGAQKIEETILRELEGIADILLSIPAMQGGNAEIVAALAAKKKEVEATLRLIQDALSGFDKVTLGLLELRDHGTASGDDFERLMADMEELARRAKLYAERR